jgi:flagellar FliL protein
MVLFIVPDDEDLSAEALQEKALLDTEELKEDGGALPDAGDKVELDLDDAPFLEEEEDEEDEGPVGEAVDAPSKAEGPSLLERLKDRRVLIPSSAALVLLAGLLLFFLLRGEDAPIQVPEGTPAEVAEEEPPPPPQEPQEPEPVEFIVSWEPFWVEHTAEDGTVRFLVCKFSAATPNEKLAWEIEHKQLVLRDAIFYYLRNKDLTFLSDKANVEVLKKDLLSVVNQYLSNDQLTELLIEDYLVK